MSARLQELLAIMERLRGSDGCPWDRAQTFASIAPYTIEEAYEVADAIQTGDMTHLKDELGDLLLQVVFHAQMAREAGYFDFEAVAAAICEKLVRRHPHVFGAAPPPEHAEWPATARGQGQGAGPGQTTAQDQGQGAGPGQPSAQDQGQGGGPRQPSAQDQGQGAGPGQASAQDQGQGGGPRQPSAQDQGQGAGPGQASAQDQEAGDAAAQQRVWEDIKARERAATTSGALGGVPVALPALMRAFKLSKRAARVGFDFPHAGQTADKVAEELAEVREAAGARAGEAADARIFEEIGDLLFAAANLARKLDVDAEAALRAANGKFERRFRGMERLAAQRSLNFESLDLAAQEALWQEVKRAE